jgi:uncharacterized protein
MQPNPLLSFVLTRRLAGLFALCLLLLSGVSGQATIPPPTNMPVSDFADLLSPGEEERLNQKLREYDLETSTQIAIVTIESLDGADPFDYSIELAEQWGIGGEEFDNGVLIFLSEQDRAIRIQTGYGVEQFLTDARSKQIIDGILSPAFRRGEFYAGLDRATDAIIDMGRGEYTETRDRRRREVQGFPTWVIVLFVLFLIFVISASNRAGDDDDDDDDGGYWRGGHYDMDRYPRKRRRRRGGGWIFIPGGGWGGGFGGGGGGGGGFGGGFGGGSFGGGGAGGSW